MADVEGRSRTRSEAGGWSGEGRPEHGDYVRPKPSGNAHIVSLAYEPPSVHVNMMCGKQWTVHMLVPAPEDPERPCAACWEAM